MGPDVDDGMAEESREEKPPDGGDVEPDGDATIGEEERQGKETSSGHDIDYEGEPEGISVGAIEEILDEGRVMAALLLTADRLERELGFVARREMDISRFHFLEDWKEAGLPKFVYFNEFFEWVEEEEPIRSVSDFRTDILHNFEEAGHVFDDEESVEVVAEIVRDALDVIERLEREREV